MGTQSNTYVMVAARLPFPSGHDDLLEKLEPYEDSAFGPIVEHDGISVVADGMNGGYIFIGKVLAKSEEGMGLEPVEIETAFLRGIIDRLHPKLEKLLDGWPTVNGHEIHIIKEAGLIIGAHVKIWVFTHYR